MERLSEFELLTQKQEQYQGKLLERIQSLESEVSKLSTLNADLSVKLTDSDKRLVTFKADYN